MTIFDRATVAAVASAIAYIAAIMIGWLWLTSLQARKPL